MKPWLLLLFLAVVCGCSNSGGESGNSSTTSNSSDSSSTLPSCDADDSFSVAPLALTDFTGLVPLGALNPTGHVFPTGHIYLYIRKSDPNDSSSAPASVNVYAPGNIRIIRVEASEHLSASPSYTDYTITFSPCKELRSYFGHVQSLSSSLSDQIGSITDSCQSYATGGESYRTCSKWVSVDVSAGTLLGTAGRAGQLALDFGMFDSRITSLAYANSSRFEAASDGFDSLHIVCPVDYFNSSLASTLRARFGDYTGTTLRTVSPLCGEVEQDEPATAQGIWFVKGTTSTYPEDPHLALVHDNVNPVKGVFSVGTSISGFSGSYSFTPASSGTTNRDFNAVTADGNIYCYDAISSPTVILQLTSATTLKIEKKSASSCSSASLSFSSAVVEFER